MNDSAHFNKVFWFIVGLTAFAAGFTIWLLIRFEGETAERFADQAMIFWLTTGAGGGIGFLIGSSMNRNQHASKPGTTTADISVTSTTTDGKETEKT